ncbi:MAG: asparagine synthase-related protein [Vicinamibacterales bacterium]
MSRELDPEALDEFLTYEYILAPRTILKHVRKVPPGSYLTYRDGQVEVRRYWDASAVPLQPWTDAEAVDALRDRLRHAVVSQMMSDVPLGAFLSGGIDSSTLVAFMSEASRLPINTFSMGFDDGSYNELAFAREVAAAFGTNHRERTVTPSLEPLFDKLVVHLDEPFADVSMFPTYMRCRRSRGHRDGGTVGRRGRRALRRLRRLRGAGPRGAARRVRRGRDAGMAARRGDAAANGEEEGAGQQGQAIYGRRGVRAERLGHYRWMVYALGAEGKRRLCRRPARSIGIARRCRHRCVRRSGAFRQGDCSTGSYADLGLLADDIW